ncbi:MAG: universal stress protein [Caldilineaceae bacterium]
MSKRKVLIPLDGTDFSRQILRVVRNYLPPETVTLVLMRVATPPLLTAERPPYGSLMWEPAIYGSYYSPAAETERRWAVTAQESETYRVALREELEVEAQRLRKQGYDVTTEVHFGDAADRIIDYVKDMAVDLVAMATHARTGLGRLMMGSVAERVLHAVAIPVLLIRTGEPSGAETVAGVTLADHIAGKGALQLTVATDGSTFGHRAIGLAHYLAKTFNAPLSALVTVSEHNEVTQSQQLTTAVNEQIADLQPPAQVTPLVGYTDETLLNYLDEHTSDLLVIGAFADRGAGPARTIGTIAQRLVQYAPTSVLMMKGYQPELRKVLVCAALDDDIVIDVATNLAKRLGAQLDLLHVVPAPTASYLAPTAAQELAVADVLSQNTHLATVLREWIGKLTQQGFSEENLHLYQGTALEAILEMGHADIYDLIVVGSQSGAGHFLGGVASGVVQLAEQSVLVVRTQAV